MSLAEVAAAAGVPDTGNDYINTYSALMPKTELTERTGLTLSMLEFNLEPN